MQYAGPESAEGENRRKGFEEREAGKKRIAMIVGIGTDMIEIARVEKACGKQAVKEAVAKSLGTGFLGFGPADIEVLRDELGKPYVKVYGGAREKARERNITWFHVSITNTNEYAVAFAVAEGSEDTGAGQVPDLKIEGGTGYEISGNRRTDEGSGPLYH